MISERSNVGTNWATRPSMRSNTIANWTAVFLTTSPSFKSAKPRLATVFLDQVESKKGANSLFKLRLYKMFDFQFAKELTVSCSESCHGFGARKALLSAIVEDEEEVLGL